MTRRFLILASSVLVFSVVACGGIQPNRGADGRPVFRADNFPRTVGSPFWCYRYVGQDGNELSHCRESQAACAGQISLETSEGVTVLSGCASQDEVTCMTYYFRTGTHTICAATKPDCDLRQAEYLGPRQVATDQLTACTTIDTSFPPGQQ